MPDVINWLHSSEPYAPEWSSDRPISAAALSQMRSWIEAYDGTLDTLPDGPLAEAWLADAADAIDAIRDDWDLDAWTWQYQGDDLVSVRRLTELRRALPRDISPSSAPGPTDCWYATVTKTSSGAPPAWPPTTDDLMGVGVVLNDSRYVGRWYNPAETAFQDRIILRFARLNSVDGTAKLRFGYIATADLGIKVYQLDSVPDEPEDDSDAGTIWAIGKTEVGSASLVTTDWTETEVDLSGLTSASDVCLAIVDADEATSPGPSFAVVRAVLSRFGLRWSLAPA